MLDPALVAEPDPGSTAEREGASESESERARERERGSERERESAREGAREREREREHPDALDLGAFDRHEPEYQCQDLVARFRFGGWSVRFGV